MGKKRMSSELTIMSLWPTLSDEGKRIIGDWIASQVKVVKTAPTSRKTRSDAGVKRDEGGKANGAAENVETA